MKITNLKTKSSAPVESVTERRNDGLEARAEQLQSNPTRTRLDGDSVKLSSGAELNELSDVVERDRTHTLDEIKAAIREGRYEIDYDHLAETLLDAPELLEE